MIEPTETESKETLDAFAETLFKIRDEDAELLHDAPHTHAISRPDEVQARPRSRSCGVGKRVRGNELPHYERIHGHRLLPLDSVRSR